MQAPGLTHKKLPQLEGPRGAWPLQLTCVAPPINKLTLLKTVVVGLNLKLWPLLINAWPPLVDCSSARAPLFRILPRHPCLWT